MDHILIVRLGSLGDIVHTIPAAAALRNAFPMARIDWLVKPRNHEILDLVSPLDGRLTIGGPLPHNTFCRAVSIPELRRRHYDIVFDFQGLLKSAAVARATGARRVVGFHWRDLREPLAAVFYTERYAVKRSAHVVDKNLSLLAAVGIDASVAVFPIRITEPSTARITQVRRRLGLTEPFCLINPGAAWSNKRWPPASFGRLAAQVHERHGMRSLVLWGPDEEPLAQAVVDDSGAAAVLAPRTTVEDVVALANAAAVMISGDTGPLHLAAAVGTPVVALFGPTDPARNGPWSPQDGIVSKYDMCECHYRRRCSSRTWCLGQIAVRDVVDAVSRRLSTVNPRVMMRRSPEPRASESYSDSC